ncbi:hypothetical protein [Pseudomonas sp. PGPPP4]|uniref:hypothetical protein n=1 Tax=Pseudomonas sp. PGPPP4 TaxID=2015556 RepID=UPI0025806290|nr:hypothetical protein [Pseudomonas sp. PGPPP4]
MQRIAIELGREQQGTPEEEVRLQELALYRSELDAALQGKGGIDQPPQKDGCQAQYHGDSADALQDVPHLGNPLRENGIQRMIAGGQGYRSVKGRV